MFEFDPAKSDANKLKHGIDFIEASALWDDPNLREIVSSQRHVGEARELAIGRLFDKTWTAIITRRGDAIRIISVRRARDYEEAAYEQARQNRG